MPLFIDTPSLQQNMSLPRRNGITVVLLILCMLLASHSFGWSQFQTDGKICREHSPAISKCRRRFLLNIIQTNIFGIVVTNNISPALASNLPESTGADISMVGSIESLIAVVALRSSLADVEKELTKRNGSNVYLDKQIPQEEVAFKKIFDSYSDPVSYKQKFLDQNAFLVYYTRGYDGPGRGNIESDMNERQTQQYGLRNEAWIAWENFLTELKFLADDDNDCTRYLHSALQAMDSYLALAPEDDLRAAKEHIGVSW